MAQNGSRFVLLCQQGLVVAVVAAVAAPAADVATLDIVAPPHARWSTASRAPMAAGPGSGTARSVVATSPVRPTVSTVPLTGVSKRGLRALDERASATSKAGGGSAARLTAAVTDAGKDRLAALSAPEHVDGLATVGVTWASGVHVPTSDLSVSVRTRRGSSWSGWHTVPYHPDEGPDPTSAEGRDARPGTDPIYVGDVADVQVRALTSTGSVPRGMKLALVDPGQETAPAAEQPAIDTGSPADEGIGGSGTPAVRTAGDTASLAAAVTAKPKIYSRAQWGADERMRDKPSLHYYEVHAGFVHHTVNANDYTRAEVPALLRGIYAYHTQSRGWSDIGYNFLVDRFGRIWEGRYGGVDRPVVGAHTLGYNDDSFAMSAIGNFDIARPPAAIVYSFARLFAWKLSLHGVRASSTHQWIEKRWLHAINGHRDVGQTACPGRYLYAKIPRIRTLAAGYQRSWAERDRDTDIAGKSYPDIVARDRKTRQAYLIRTGRGGGSVRVTATGTYLKYANAVLDVGDWNGDGHGDMVARSGRSGRLYLYRGTGTGRFRAPVLMKHTDYGHLRMLTAVGDYTGDGRPDLLAQPATGSMRIYPGTGGTGLRRSYVAHSAVSGIQQLGVGLWTSDGAPDTVVRHSNGSLTLYPGNGPGGLTGGSRVRSLGTAYDVMMAAGDITGDGRTDLVGRGKATGNLWVFPRTSDGLGSRRLLAPGMGRFDLMD